MRALLAEDQLLMKWLWLSISRYDYEFVVQQIVFDGEEQQMRVLLLVQEVPHETGTDHAESRPSKNLQRLMFLTAQADLIS